MGEDPRQFQGPQAGPSESQAKPCLPRFGNCPGLCFSRVCPGLDGPADGWAIPGPSLEPGSDYDAETTIQRALNGTGGGWPLPMEVVLPLTVLVALRGAVGTGAVCWPLCFRVRRGPYLACVLHLAAADSLSLGCTALVLLEEVFELGPQPTLQAATILHPVSRCCDVVGLCLLAGLGFEGSLSVLAPAWSCCRCPGDLGRGERPELGPGPLFACGGLGL